MQDNNSLFNFQLLLQQQNSHRHIFSNTILILKKSMSNFILKFSPIRTFDDVIRRDGNLMWKILGNIHWTLLRIGELHKCLTFYIHVYPFLKQCTFLPIT